jgi:hypothetical protein
VDFVTKFEKALRKKHQALMTDLAKIEHLIDAFEKGRSVVSNARAAGYRRQGASEFRWRKSAGGLQRKNNRLVDEAGHVCF